MASVRGVDLLGLPRVSQSVNWSVVLVRGVGCTALTASDSGAYF